MAQRVGTKIEPHYGADSLTMAIQVHTYYYGTTTVY